MKFVLCKHSSILITILISEKLLKSTELSHDLPQLLVIKYSQTPGLVTKYMSVWVVQNL